MSKQKRTSKVTTSHKITLGAVSVLGVAAGWNVIGRAAGQSAAADEQTVAAEPIALPEIDAPRINPTPWPTIAPLQTNPRLAQKPLPTLVAVAVPVGPPASNAAATGDTTMPSVSSLPSIAPLPTLAPLPAMPEYVAPPPPPAAPQQVAAAPPPPPSGGGNVSKGS